MGRLRVDDSPDAARRGTTVEIDACPFSIGRIASCSLHIDDVGISRRHVLIHADPDGLWFEDLGSANGCRLNGTPTGRAWLRDGDRLQIGLTTLVYEDPAARNDGETLIVTPSQQPSPVPSLPDAPPAAIAPVASRSRTPLWLALGCLTIMLLPLLVGGAWWLRTSRARSLLTIEDVYPREGPPGSYVVVEIGGTIDPSRIGARYGDTPLSVTGLGERCIGVQIPLDATPDSLRLFEGSREAASVPFAIVPPAATTLLRSTVSPSPESQTVEAADGVTVSIPGGLLDEPRAITVSRVANAPVYRENPFEPIEVIDVSIEGMEQLSDYVEIGIPYDPAQLDPKIPVEANFAPMRWDEDGQRWVDLYYRVDAQSSTLYIATDHLSAFWTGFSLVGLGKTALIVGVVGGTISEVAERWVNDKYLSRNLKVRILYSDKALRKTFPDEEWKSAIAPARLGVAYDPAYSAAVQDIAHVLEESLARYMAAGFPDPTKKGIGGVHIYTRYVKVKVDSLYNYYVQQGEMAHETFWDTIHLPSEILKLEFFDPVVGSRGTFDEHFLTFKSLLAHELFHVIQRPYYGVSIVFTGTPHKWWREATAEWAGHDLAKIPARPGWDKDSPSIRKRLGPQFLRHPINSTGKIAGTCALVGGLDYEYLSPVLVRYLVNERGLTIKQLIDLVATDQASDPLVPLRKRLERTTGRSFDDFYSDFSVWLLRDAELPLSSFANPKNANVAAARSDVLMIDEDEATLRFYQADTGQVAAHRVTVFRTTEGREHLTTKDTPALVIDASHPETWDLDVSDGDTLYLVAANGSTRDATVGLTIQRTNDDGKWENAAYQTMKIAGNGTATIWALRVAAGGLVIEPDKIDDARGYEPYEFRLRASEIPKDVSEVVFEYDFGDGLETSKGTATAKVIDGTAEATLEHVYEPSPGLKGNRPVRHVLEVTLVHGGRPRASASAAATVGLAEVVVTPRRLIGPPGDGFEFDATARPQGEYVFEWSWPGRDSPRRTEGTSSSVSFALGDFGEHPVTVKLFNRRGLLLAEDRVTAAVEEDDGEEAETPPVSSAAGRWVLTKQWSDTWTHARSKEGKAAAKASDGSATIDLVATSSVLTNGKYVTVYESFNYGLSWTPFPTSLEPDEPRELRLSIDSFKVPKPGYVWVTGLEFYNGWYETKGEAPPKPALISHLRASGARWEGIGLLGPKTEGKPTTRTLTWRLRRNPHPGEKQVVTLRVYGHGINGQSAAAVHVYYEYTYQK